VVDAAKALAHPGRLRILAMLRDGDLCVCQMTGVLELAASTVSAHLSDLRRAGLVTERKSGKWVHYHLVDEGELAGFVGRALQLVEGDERLRQDARVLSAVRRVPLAAFCRVGVAGAATRAGSSRPAPARRTESPTAAPSGRHTG
jgi:DNA-binding transcriptional ArsR family regulator